MFVAMAGISWLVEACAGKAAEAPRGGGGQAGSSGTNTLAGGPGQGGTGGSDNGGSATGGGTPSATGGVHSGTTASINTGGLHDVPCE
jgi:DNA polymerase-3 subunit gamma/tau